MPYATLAQLREYLGLQTAQTGDDGLLTRLLAGVQAAIDADTSRTFEAGADSTRYFDTGAINGQMLTFDTPLASLTSITNGDSQAISAGNVVLQPRNQAPYFAMRLKLEYAWQFSTADSEIAVTGKWAVSLTAPANIVQATLRWAAYHYQLKDSQVFEATANAETGQMIILKGVPPDVVRFLAPYKSYL